MIPIMECDKCGTPDSTEYRISVVGGKRKTVILCNKHAKPITTILESNMGEGPGHRVTPENKLTPEDLEKLKK